MIFVTLGTQDKQFNRLLDAVLKLNTNEQIIIQAGTTRFPSDYKDNIKIYKFISKNDFDEYMKKASCIITHAGVGTIMLGLKYHKKMIVAARLKKYKEHENDHQLQIQETFEKQGYILALKDFEDLEKLIRKEFTPKEFITNNNNFNEKLYNKIYLGK